MVRSPLARRRDADVSIYALDMGNQMYGDCLLVVSGKTSILIDGGHSSDFVGQKGFDSIPAQLETVLGPPPFEVSLLVVTHCHADHIGCLPRMVSEGLLQPRWALVADERIGFGRGVGELDMFADMPLAAQGVLAALREEDRTGMDEEELSEFLLDAATLESKYKTMLEQLTDANTRVVRYGRDDHSALVAAFADVNLQILGPTVDHLVLCAEAIAKATKAARDELTTRYLTDSFADAIDVYRALTKAPWDAVPLLDRPGKGAAINDQSIILTVGTGERKALLVGDMQLAKAEVSGLAPHMADLRMRIATEGPYKFFKLPHHTSYNGVDEIVLKELSYPKFLVHTGGRNDAGHPDKGSLQMLEELSDSIEFARTDRHGLIRYDLSGKFTVAGDLNDFSLNASNDITPELPKPEISAEVSVLEEEPQAVEEEGPEFLEFVYVKVPNRPMSFQIGGVPISIGAKGSAHISKGGFGPDKARSDPATLTLAGGRKLPNLLFVTDVAKLRASIGQNEAAAALRMIEAAGHRLKDVQGADKAEDAVRRAISGAEGVVLVGGYGVVPSQRVDVLDPGLRGEVGSRVYDDPDEFIVWSDDVYGDVDGDQLAELPVTRIPDGGSSGLLLGAMSGSKPAPQGRFGLINHERPFAKAIWSLIEGQEASLVSGPSIARGLTPSQLERRNLYFMLHGDHQDGARFWGEMDGAVEAITVSNLPASGPDIVFAGCCWGALTVDQLALRRTGPLGVKGAGQSMALGFLKSGARAFVGCTGAHYSPGEGEDYFGAPMHKAFWTRVKAGDAPALALFNARKAYLAALPHGLSQPYHIAIERKIYRQFTSLGLAW